MIYNKDKVLEVLDEGTLMNMEVAKELGYIPDNVKTVPEIIEDQYHTMDELYDHRTILFAIICNNAYRITEDVTCVAWKSKKHSDGTSEEGWFIAGIYTSKGQQITYHQKIEFWDMFKVQELDKAPEFDGHTSSDVLERLKLNFI